MGGQQFIKARGLAGQDFLIGRVLKVQPYQLLLASDDAQLDGGLEPSVASQLGFYAGLRQQFFQFVAGFVFAHYREQGDLGTQCGHVQSDVGGAAAAFLFAGYAHHRHRRFGRNAVHRAVPVAV